MNDRKFRSRVTYGLVACGAGLFGEAEMEAGVIALSASPTTIAFGGSAAVTLTPLNAAFVQFNDNLGKSLDGGSGFLWAAVSQGQRIDKNILFLGSMGIGTNAAGDRLFAFKQGSHYGWIKENLGGSGGAITFLSGAYNDGTDLNNDYIDAGTLNGGTAGGGFASVPEPGTTGLMGVAALAVGASALRRRRAAKAAAVASAS